MGREFQKLIDVLQNAAESIGVYLLGLSGAVIVVMLIWAGLQYVQGNAEAGKKTLTAALVGAAIIALASMIIKLVMEIGGFTG
jgi:hypothetical protein